VETAVETFFGDGEGVGEGEGETVGDGEGSGEAVGDGTAGATMFDSCVATEVFRTCWLTP